MISTEEKIEYLKRRKIIQFLFPQYHMEVLKHWNKVQEKAFVILLESYDEEGERKTWKTIESEAYFALDEILRKKFFRLYRKKKILSIIKKYFIFIIIFIYIVLLLCLLL